jgi:hypothetical protein
MKGAMRKVLPVLILISLTGQKGEEADILLRLVGFSDSSLPRTPSSAALSALGPLI